MIEEYWTAILKDEDRKIRNSDRKHRYHFKSLESMSEELAFQEQYLYIPDDFTVQCGMQGFIDTVQNERLADGLRHLTDRQRQAIELYQVFVDYERDMERQRKAESRHRDSRSLDTCLLFEVSTETLEQTYERMRILQEIENILQDFTPKQRRRFLLHFACGYTYREIAEMEGNNKSTVMRSAKTVLKKIQKKLAA